MKALLKKYTLPALGAILGAIAGYIYWYYWGCEDGCSIRSVWWRMSLWEAVMGGLVLSMLQDWREKRAQEE